jgi:hypothetical protein
MQANQKTNSNIIVRGFNSSVTFTQDLINKNLFEITFPMISMGVQVSKLLFFGASLATTALPLIIGGTFLALAIMKIIIEKIEANAYNLSANRDQNKTAELQKTITRCIFAYKIYEFLYNVSSIASIILLTVPALQKAGEALMPAIILTSLDLINIPRLGHYTQDIIAKEVSSSNKPPNQEAEDKTHNLLTTSYFREKVRSQYNSQNQVTYICP